MRTTEREKSCSPVIVRIEQVLKDKQLTQKQLIKELGLGSSTFTRWKYDNGKSYLKYIDQIADFLGVSTDYLLHGNQDNQQFTSQEIKLVTKFRNSSKEVQEAIICLLENLKPSTSSDE